jgi:hypothetical protein
MQGERFAAPTKSDSESYPAATKMQSEEVKQQAKETRFIIIQRAPTTLSSWYKETKHFSHMFVAQNLSLGPLPWFSNKSSKYALGARPPATLDPPGTFSDS